jgi:hypothetical protein
MSSQQKPKNRPSTAAHDAQIIVGVEKDLQNVSQIPLDGDTYTPQSLVAFIQSRIDANNKVLTTKAAWADATKTYKALNTKGSAVVRALRSFVVGMYGEQSPKLADFGFTPSKRATQTADQKAAAAAKRKATREARGTTSKKQKSKIHGTVTPAQAAAAGNGTPANASTPAAPAAPTVNVVVNTPAPATATQTTGTPAPAAPAPDHGASSPQANGAPAAAAPKS